MYLACPDWALSKVWYPYRADVLVQMYDKRYCTIAYLYIHDTIHTCMHWCAWLNPSYVMPIYVCTCMHDMTWILSLLVEARELSWTVPSFKLECFEIEIRNDPKPHLNWQDIWLNMVDSEEQRHAPRSKQLSCKPRIWNWTIVSALLSKRNLLIRGQNRKP